MKYGKTRALFEQKQLLQSSSGDFSGYLSKLKALGLSPDLAQNLQHIIEVERVLVAINNIFHFCQVKDGVELDEVIKKLIEKEYDYSHLPASLPDMPFPRRNDIQPVLSALNAVIPDYEQAITSILHLNTSVMNQRNGAAWVELEPGRKIRVRVKNEAFTLATQQALQDKWDYDYFIGSYLSMACVYLGKVYA